MHVGPGTIAFDDLVGADWGITPDFEVFVL